MAKGSGCFWACGKAAHHGRMYIVVELDAQLMVTRK
jgi:hypothetical protein